MIVIVRYRFSAGKWTVDFYDKVNAREDFTPDPMKWYYVSGLYKYPLIPKVRERLMRAERLIDGQV